MSDLTKLLANIGGALSAQGAGGSEGLQQFMATLAQQQAQEASQRFAREQSTRDQMFTMHRDRLARQHDVDMQERRLAAEKAEKAETYEAQAGILYNYARSSPEAQAALEEHLRTTTPGLVLSNGEMVPIDWTPGNADTKALLMSAAKAGFDVNQARAVGQVRSEGEQWYRTATGATKSYTTATQLAKDQQNHTTAQQRLDNLQTRLNVANQEIEDLAGNEGRSLESSYARAKQIAEVLAALGAEYEELVGSDTYGLFFAEGAGLFNAGNTFAANVGVIGERLATSQRTLTVDNIGAWNPADPLAFPPLKQGYGGGEGEEGDFQKAMRTESFKAQKKTWNEMASWLDTLPQVDLEFLTDADRKLVTDIKEYVADDGRLDLEHLMMELRHATVTEDGQQKVANIADMVSRVSQFNKPVKEIAIARGRAYETSVSETMAISNTFRHSTALGYELFPTAEEARAAIDTYGIQDQGSDQKRAPRTEEERTMFLQRVVGSEDGLKQLAKHLYGGLQGDAEGVELADAMDQLELKGDRVLKKLGLEDPDTRHRLYKHLQEWTGIDSTARLEAQGGAINEIHDYNFRRLDLVTDPFAKSYYDMLSPKDQDEWANDFVAKVFAAAPAPAQMADTLRYVIDQFKGARKAYEQPSAWSWDAKRFKGDDKRLRLQREVAAENGDTASFYDLFDLWRQKDARFADYQDEAGRMGDFAFTRRSSYRFGVQGGVPQTVYKDWAQGDAATYIYGENSYVKRYEADVPVEKQDQNVINMLDRLDYMRGMDLTSLENLTLEERTLMVGIQNHLREKPLAETLRAISGDDTTGAPPVGFSFADLGLSIASPETQADALAARESADLRSRVIDIPDELKAVGRGMRQLRRIITGTTTFMDVDPRDERVDYDIVDEQVIEAAQKELELASDQLTILQHAQKSSIVNSFRPRVGRSVAGKAFTNPEELAAVLTEQLPTITGAEYDVVALEKGPIHPMLEDLGQAETNSEAIDIMLDIFAETTTSLAQRQAISLSTMTPQERREATLREAKRDFRLMRVELNAIAQHIGAVASAEGGYSAANLPGGLQNYVDVESFNTLAKKAGNPDVNALLAMHVWSAYQALENR
jgi:hypothetical protein